MRVFQIDENDWCKHESCGVSDGLTLPCSNCKKHTKWDYVVTDWLWDKVVPNQWKRDVICFDCFEQMCILVDLQDELPKNIKSLQFTGKNMTIEFIPANTFKYNKNGTNN